MTPAGITHIKAVDIGGVGWSFAENKDAAEVGAIGPEATTRTDEVIKVAAVVGERDMSQGDSQLLVR